MSMQPVLWPEPDPQIAAAIKAMYGSRKTERPLAVEIRDRLGQWLDDLRLVGLQLIFLVVSRAMSLIRLSRWED
jgi:hypothetical protein